MRQDRDRRWKCISVDALHIAALFNKNAWSVSGDWHTQQCYFDGLPSDVVVDAVSWDAMSQCFTIFLYHPTFDVVDLGSHVPTVHGTIHTFYLPACRTFDEAVSLGRYLNRTDEEKANDMVHILAEA